MRKRSNSYCGREWADSWISLFFSALRASHLFKWRVGREHRRTPSASHTWSDSDTQALADKVPHRGLGFPSLFHLVECLVSPFRLSLKTRCLSSISLHLFLRLADCTLRVRAQHKLVGLTDTAATAALTPALFGTHTQTVQRLSPGFGCPRFAHRPGQPTRTRPDMPHAPQGAAAQSFTLSSIPAG